MFFFEEKNQKTFVPRSVSILVTPPQKVKVFCFFSSEKKAFFSYLVGRGGVTL
jgi:hypothetical protein